MATENANGTNEQAVASEQARTAIKSVFASMEETGAAAQALVNSQRDVSRFTRSAQEESEAMAEAVQALTASISGVRTDAASLAASVDSTQARLGEAAQAVQGVSGRAMEASAILQEHLVGLMNVSELASVTMTRSEANASATEEVAVTVVQMTDGIVQVATKVGQVLDGVSRDTTSLAAMVETTASATKDLARTMPVVAETARLLETSAVSTASAVKEVVASMELAAATAEKSADTVDTHAATTEQLAHSVQRVAHGARQLSCLAATSVTASSQLEASTRRMAQLVEVARVTGERVSTTAREDGATVARSIAGFSHVRQSITESSGVMKELARHAEELGDIVQTLNLIADRTNLLSLHASVEAARAGEHGRGFVVVAEEIRALADQAAAASADAAKRVQGLRNGASEAMAATDDSVHAADEGAALALDAERALGSILKVVDELGTTVREVSRATQQQVQAVQSLSQATARVSEQGRLIAASAMEQARAARTLAQGASEVRRMVRQTTQAAVDQARALRDTVRSNEQLAAAAEQVARGMQMLTAGAEELAEATTPMRALGLQLSMGIVGQDEEAAHAGIMAQDAVASTQRALVELAGQIKAAAEIARGMNDLRTRATGEASIISQVHAGAKQNLSTGIELERRLRGVLDAACEQHEALASLTGDGEEVRRLARQTSRTLDEQTKVVSTFAAASISQAAALGAVARAASEQVTLSEQLAGMVEHMRGRARELPPSEATQV